GMRQTPDRPRRRPASSWRPCSTSTESARRSSSRRSTPTFLSSRNEPRSRPAVADRIKVLIVDDIPETRDHLSKLLGFESDVEVVGSAAGGAEATEQALALKPDVVLMDINMPGMDGITATEKLASDVPTAAVVMMSVQGEADYLRRSMLAGAREFLVKPFSSDELTASIRQVWTREKEKQSRFAPIATSA